MTIHGTSNRTPARRTAGLRTAERVAKAARLPLLLALLMAALAITSLVAQEAGQGAPTLTLQEALELARTNNPAFLSQRNDQAVADWQVREAYGAFLPTAQASGGFSYTAAGVQRIGTLDFGQQSTDWFSSSYRLGLNWSLDGNTIFGAANARASSAATAARIDAAEFNLESQVTLQYMTALRARDAVDVAQRQLDRARRNLQLVETRVGAGAAAGVDGKTAEVEFGRAEVALIQAERQLRAEKLRLMEQIGVALEDVTLASSFEVFQPGWTRDELLERALEAHPSLRAFEAQERAGRAGLRQARSQYFPSLGVSTAFSGNTLQALNEDFLVGTAESNRLRSFETCQAYHEIQSQLGVVFPNVPASCGTASLSADERAEILSENNVFPFNFTKNPISLSLGVSIPVFTGFTQERQVEQAEAFARDAQHQRRAEELRLRTAVTESFDALQSATRVVEIEERNRAVAEERLTLARQRYALGAAGIIELLDAETSMTTAERDYLNAVYQFHQSLVALEAATGRSLRPGAEEEDDAGSGQESSGR